MTKELRYAVRSPISGIIAWFILKDDAEDFIGIQVDTYYTIEEVYL